MTLRKSVTLDDAETAREVLGTRDAHLRRVRETFSVTAVLRGGKLLVEGPKREVSLAAAAFEEMRRVVESSGRITPQDVARILGGCRGTQNLSSATGLERNAMDLEDKYCLPRQPGDWPTERLVVGRGREVEARTAGQAEYARTMRENDLVFCVGPAGTGKTYLAVAMALSELEAGRVNRIALARPAVEAGERLGFLPGDERQKVNPYLRPLYDALTDMVSRSTLGRLTDQGVLEIVPLAYMRGRTLGHSFVILDEAQNTTSAQMLMFLTRLGLHSRAVVTGDITQIDLSDPAGSGLVETTRILAGIKGIGIVHLSEKDIVRHPLVRNIIAAYEAERQGAAGPRAARKDPPSVR